MGRASANEPASVVGAISASPGIAKLLEIGSEGARRLGCTARPGVVTPLAVNGWAATLGDARDHPIAGRPSLCRLERTPSYPRSLKKVVASVSTMQIAEFIRLVSGEPGRVVSRNVLQASTQKLAEASRPGGMSLKDLMAAPPARTEQKLIRYGHVLSPPASPQTIATWCQNRPSYRLPPDLRALVEHTNGIHLWANLETGRCYEGLAPIEEWDLARAKMPGSLLDERYVALTCHQDGASFVVVDLVSGKCSLMDAAGPDTSTPIGGTAADLLDWLWKSRIAPNV